MNPLTKKQAEEKIRKKLELLKKKQEKLKLSKQ
jgi:hypothetical protein